jgi:tetratricopeptide (TPR) repeat protein
MKKVIIAVFVSALSAIAFGQPAKQVTAYNYMQSGEFMKAREAIDAAAENEKTMDKEKTWRYRGQIYQQLAINDLGLDRMTAVKESLRSFKKAMELDEKDAWKKENYNDGYAQVMLYAVNLGILAYNETKYADSRDYFVVAADAAAAMGAVDTMAIYNGGLAAEQAQDYAGAVQLYQKSADIGYLEGKMYIYMANVYDKMGDTDKYLATLQEGRKKYPNDTDLIVYELNYYLKNNRFEEAERNLQLAIEKDPTNKQLHFSLGVVYDNLGMKDKAIKAYTDAIAIDANYFDAVYNLGALYFNQGVEMNNASNDIQDIKKYNAARAEAKEVFKKALPFLEKSHELDPTDRGALASLSQLYALLGDNDNYLKIKAKLDQGN